MRDIVVCVCLHICVSVCAVRTLAHVLQGASDLVHSVALAVKGANILLLTMQHVRQTGDKHN